MPIAPIEVKNANARECPMLPIIRDAHQQPMKNPRKCEEPNIPIWALLKPCFSPVSASSGATPPDNSCNRMTERKRAASEGMGRLE